MNIYIYSKNVVINFFQSYVKFMILLQLYLQKKGSELYIPSVGFEHFISASVIGKCF